MDIGGGSVEFILANKDSIFFSKSYPVGAAVLLKDFHQSDPVSEEEIERMHRHFEVILADLFEAAGKFPPQALAGASGSFDTIGEILFFPKTEAELYAASDYVKVWESDFSRVYDQLIKTILEQRLKLQGLLPLRADLIVVSVVLIKFILDKLEIKEIFLSNYALKEGLLKRIISGKINVAAP